MEKFLDCLLLSGIILSSVVVIYQIILCTFWFLPPKDGIKEWEKKMREHERKRILEGK